MSIAQNGVERTNKSAVLRLVKPLESAFEWTPSHRDGKAVPCAMAIVLSLVAFAVTWFVPAIRTQAPATLFLFAVICTSLYGGIVPGLLASGLSLLAINALLAPSVLNPFASTGLADLARVSVFVMIAVVVSVLDHQRRKAESSLRNRERHLTRLVENSSDIITILAPDGTIRYESAALERVTGHKVEAIVGRNVFDFVHPDDIAAAHTELANILATPGATSQPVEFRFRIADGSYRTLEAIGKNLVEEPGVAGILIHSRDVTVRKQLVREKAAREEAEAAKRRFHDLVQGLEVIVWEADPATRRFTFVSRRVQEVLGYTPESWMDGAWMEHVFEEDRRRVAQHWRNASQAGVSDCEYRGISTSGRLLWLRLITYADRDEAGAVRQLRGLIVDVTERRQAEATLRLTERLAATGRLAASIAHEINNPMAAVTNLVYLIENYPDVPESAKQFARLAQDELKRMAHITRQMLGFYRESTHSAPVEVKELLDGVLDLYNRRIKNSGVSVSLQYEKSALVDVYAGEIRQVFSNLLINALDALPSGGRVVIRVRDCREACSDRAGVRISFADNGPGIPAETVKRIFEPFFTTKGQKGTGLGLWVSDGIVRKHQGTLRVRSSRREDRRGTCFSIFLPAAAPRAAGATSAA